MLPADTEQTAHMCTLGCSPYPANLPVAWPGSVNDRLKQMQSVSGSAAVRRTFCGTRRVMQATSGLSGSSERPNPRCRQKGD